MDAPICPGCHVGCSLDAPQCARGLERFRPMWLRGEEIPVRRGPGGPGKGGQQGPGGPKGPGARAMSQDQRLMFLLTELMPRTLGSLKGNPRDQVLAAITRQEGGMTYTLLPERTHLDEPTLYGVLEELLAEGLVVDDYTEWGAQFYWVTDEGRAVTQEAESRRKQLVAERFAEMTEDEKAQLEELLNIILHGRA